MTTLRKTALSIAITLAAATAAGAQAPANSTRPFSIGLAGGAALPTGTLSSGAAIAPSGVNTGYNLTGMLGVNLPESPWSLRGDVGYNDFGGKGTGNPSTKAIPVTGNLVYNFQTLPGAFHPYLVGGAGLYHMSQNQLSNTVSENDFGWNAGGGIAIPLSGFNAFVEARYNHVSLGDKMGNGSISFVPLVFGVSF